ncbi:hypothetical protein L596_002876 [Steinernema carpocapsae]|uniref:acid phosphatase n=1 Tax=Steinernema carpocapsae TaxID=34508 RepID=A0A4U8UQH6_STECR|nr:hypothetical protein L596_002876 [Steinernema carpocapsae]
MRSSVFIAAILFCGLAPVLAKDKLVLLQAAWRHGARSPTDSFPKDEYKESDWHLGWGQLTAEGMEQHVKLGTHLRERYLINKTEFDFDMDPTFKSSHQLYVRATDVNRTIISAMSNMIGFYDMVNTAKNGTDYPSIDAWPTGFVPIAIHNTVPYDLDHVGNPDADCQLYGDLWDAIHASEVYVNASENNAKLLDKLTNYTGMKVTLDNLWIVSDDLFIQNDTNRAWPDWVTEDLYKQIHELNNQVQEWQNGVGLQNLTVHGQKVGTLVKQTRGGSLVWSMLNHMQQKKQCLTGQNGKEKKCRWMNDLRYFVYSAHDTTLDALLTALGSVREVLKNGTYDGEYPHYSAAVTMELLQSDDSKYYVRANYWHPRQNYARIVFTKYIQGCETIKDDKCPLETMLSSLQFLQPPKGETIESVTEPQQSFYLFSSTARRESLSSRNPRIPPSPPALLRPAWPSSR